MAYGLTSLQVIHLQKRKLADNSGPILAQPRKDPGGIIFFVQRCSHYSQKGGEDLHLHLHLHMHWMLGVEAARTVDAKATK